MKVLGLVGCCALVPLIVLVSFRSANCAEPSPRPADSSETMCRCAGPASPAAARIAQILAEPLKASGLDFTEEPLENVVNFLQDEYNIPIQIDVPALEDAGLTTDEPITVHLSNISLRSALQLLLKTKQLTYILRNEVMIITTPEVAENNLVTCVYDVRDVLNSMGGEREIKNLANVVVSCVAFETWATNKGGEAQVKTLRPGLLVISQTQAVHEQVAELLSAIRATLHQSDLRKAGRGMEMMGRGGYEMSDEGMGGFGGGYGGRGGMEGGYGGGRGGEMGGEPTPAAANPFE